MANEPNMHLRLAQRLNRLRDLRLMRLYRRNKRFWNDEKGRTCNFYSRICDGASPRFDVRSLSYPLPCCSDQAQPHTTREDHQTFRRFLRLCRTLEELEIQSAKLCPSLMSACTSTRLTRLKIAPSEDPRLDVRHLLPAKHSSKRSWTRSLRRLDMTGVFLVGSSDPVAHIMDRCPKLKYLRMRSNNDSWLTQLIVDDDARGRVIFEFGQDETPGAPKMRWISNWFLSRSVVSLEVFDERGSVDLEIVAMMMTPRLTTLSLIDVKSVREGFLKEILRRCPRLENVALSFRRPWQSLALDDLVHPRMRSLSLSGCHLYSRRKCPALPSMRELKVVSCAIGGRHFWDVVAKSERLRSLWVHGTNVEFAARLPSQLSRLTWIKSTTSWLGVDFASVFHDNIRRVNLVGGTVDRERVERHVDRVLGLFDCEVEYEPVFRFTRKNSS